jgi:hypothetical protein
MKKVFIMPSASIQQNGKNQRLVHPFRFPRDGATNPDNLSRNQGKTAR